MNNIQMVDLKSQYNKIKDQIDTAVIQIKIIYKNNKIKII